MEDQVEFLLADNEALAKALAESGNKNEELKQNIEEEVAKKNELDQTRI